MPRDRSGRAKSAAVLVMMAILIAVVAHRAPGTSRGAGSSFPRAQTSPAATPSAATPIAATPEVATPVAAAAPLFRVDVVDRDYEPGGLRVSVGATVRWVNRDGVTHTVSSVDGSFDSRSMRRGEVFTHTFTEPGAYPYECDLHLDMSGAVVVTAS